MVGAGGEEVDAGEHGWVSVLEWVGVGVVDLSAEISEEGGAMRRLVEEWNHWVLWGLWHCGFLGW